MSRISIVAGAVLIVAGITNSAYSQSYVDPVSYFRPFVQSKNVAQGLQNYPYQIYLAGSKITEIDNLQRTRLQVNRLQSRVGDRFIAYLGQTYATIVNGCTSGKFDTANTDTLIQTGLAILRKVEALREADRGAYRLFYSLSYFLLSNASECIAQDIERDTGWLRNLIKGKRVEHEARIKLLRTEHIYVRVPESQFEKAKSAFRNCLQGDCEYLLSRIPLVSRKKEASSKTIMLSDDRSLHPASGEVGAHIFKMTRGPDTLGSAVFMPRNLVNVEYIAAADPVRATTVEASFKRLREDRSKLGQQVIAATTAGFTNASREPEGLVTHNGKTVNPVLRPDQDALVVLQPDGSARVINLRNPNGFQLPGLDHFINPRLRFIDYAELMEWINDKAATVFQTQLLAWDDRVLVQPQAPRQLRERRMFAAAYDKNNELRLVLIDILKQYPLLEQTDDIVIMLNRRGLRVVWLLNLDVGSFNILEVFDEAGVVLSQPHGRVPMASATNLLIFTTRR